MKQIAIIKDEDFGLKSKEFNNPRIRYGARGIVINGNLIAVFNKSNKNEYKLPGGGIDEGENPEIAFKREVKEETGCEVEIIKCLGTIEEHKTLDNFKQISYVFVSKVIKDTKVLDLTDKEKDEGAKLLWLDEKEALDKITNCLNELKESNYENLYHSKFIVTRDRLILEYYLNTMIKVIAFDLVGTLVKERDIDLTELESKLERLFGPNISDEEYIEKVLDNFNSKEEVVNKTLDICNKLYEIKYPNLIKNLIKKYPNIKIIIATNHLTYIKDYLKTNFKLINEYIISSDIHLIKPNKEYYLYMLKKYNIKPCELLFIDDNQDNIDSANSLEIRTIKVNKDTDIIKEIESTINNCKQ